MPPQYGLCVAAGIVGFVIVLAGLAALYIWLIYSGVEPILRGTIGTTSTVTLPGAVFRVALGLMLFLLTWRALRRQDPWPGIEVTRGSCPELEQLVASCAERAGVKAPDAIYLMPDTNIAAFSSGVIRSAGLHANFISIGALFLPFLSRGEWEAALFHEFAHLVMRREQWAVNLDNRIREFVPRLRLINRRGAKVFLFAVSGARFLLFGYWSLFNLLMAPLRRREELLADAFAAAHCGSICYARCLTLAVTLQQVLEGEVSDRIGGLFHAALLGSNAQFGAPFEQLEPASPAAAIVPVSPETFPNWFKIVVRSQSGEVMSERIKATFDWLRDTEQQRAFDEHPTLRLRLDQLGAPFPPRVEELLTDDPRLVTEETWQRRISFAFAERFRSQFYQAKGRAKLAADYGFTAASVTSFPCCWSGCNVHHRAHLLIAKRGMRWFFTDGPGDFWPWSLFQSVNLYPSGRASGRNGPLILALFAMFYDVPAASEVELVWYPEPAGVRRQTLQVFHLRDNMEEAMHLLWMLWSNSRQIQPQTPAGENRSATAS
ncbi:MAG: M48 family metalloprotease [Acidobacteriaceae bacterium]|nr:M48 family metalloprotease [Acidobacteriaceae bacterium]